MNERSLEESISREGDVGTVMRMIEEGNQASVRRLLEETALCESDLHGIIQSLRVAGLIEPIADAQPGVHRYRLTSAGQKVVGGLGTGQSD